MIFLRCPKHMELVLLLKKPRFFTTETAKWLESGCWSLCCCLVNFFSKKIISTSHKFVVMIVIRGYYGCFWLAKNGQHHKFGFGTCSNSCTFLLEFHPISLVQKSVFADSKSNFSLHIILKWKTPHQGDVVPPILGLFCGCGCILLCRRRGVLSCWELGGDAIPQIIGNL